MIRIAILTGVALVSLTACGGSDTAGSQPTVTATATTTVTTTVTAPPTPTSGGSSPAARPSVQAGVVPNVVGLNHQLAQDTMQAAGFFYLTEEDATGQGRLLIDDRNWVVVSQQPTAGTKAPADTKIVLRSKKIGE